MVRRPAPAHLCIQVYMEEIINRLTFISLHPPRAANFGET